MEEKSEAQSPITDYDHQLLSNDPTNISDDDILLTEKEAEGPIPSPTTDYGQSDSRKENDPVRFSNTNKRLSFEQKNYILNLGASQPTSQQMPFQKFPKTNKYSFHPEWYTRTLPDGSIGFRKWLSYSISCGNTLYDFIESKIEAPS
ncbi:uncharacterized protein LOC132947811 [Metopolophium dirhodum]|uniref:uncharacterized protein LOC132947811 n=1 Tax=Metopolophium dirhodum TaxID=44670 RepID=UPI0029904D24|nr:uncharacterized protein LOC132947811 [Metopolophium dirhodum]